MLYYIFWRIFLTLAEQKFRQKCNELKKRISEIEQSNEIATIALSRTRISIRRLRLENSVLLERLEHRLVSLSDNSETKEDLSRPTSPVLTDDLLNLKAARNGLTKSKKPKTVLNTSSTTKKLARDPDLPKKPLNAYWIFFEKEKERVKAELEAKGSEKPTADVSKTLTDMWKALSDDEKRPYQKLFEEDRVRYQREMSVFNQKKDTETSKPGDRGNGDQGLSEAEEEHSEVQDDLPESEGIKRQKLNPSTEGIAGETKQEAVIPEANSL